MPREGARAGALSGDGEGHLLRSPVRKERLSKSKQELAEEAARVIHQADKVDCVSKGGVHPDKFYTLPARKKHPDFNPNSLGRSTKRRNSDEVTPPKKPPRTFAFNSGSNNSKPAQRSSIFNIFSKTEKEPKPKKSNLRRSVSDASNLKTHNNNVRSRTISESEDTPNLKTKKQLSPIIEVTQREDYFAPADNLRQSASFKENNKNVENEIKPPARKKDKKTSSVTEQLKEYIDEVDTAILNETTKPPEIVIIDVDKAEKISSKSKPKLNTFGKKLKAITKKSKSKKEEIKKEESKKEEIKKEEYRKQESKKQESKAVEKPEKKESEMIHSSQQPVDKLPLTRGRTVDTMVKRLSHEGSSPPPKTNIMISPNVSVQHNNNQPFSYTRGVSPERNPIIYAQVVCGSNGSGAKQTVHTTYTNGKKHLPHSDSDEGLGYEENSNCREKSITHFGDEKYNYSDDRFDEEFPITPKFKSNGYNGYTSYENKFSKVDQNGVFIDSSSRGRGDGMDSKRRESLTEPDHGISTKFSGSMNNLNRKDLSARRDLLESRINRRFGDKAIRNSPTNVYVTETSSRYYRSGSASPIGVKEKFVSETKTDRNGVQYTTNVHTKKYLGTDERDGFKDYRYNSFENEPKSFDSQISDYRSSPENRHFETSHRTSHHSSNNKYTAKTEKLSKDRDYYKSNPEIAHRAYNYDDHRRYQDSYHDSLKREKHEAVNGKYFDQNECERKDKFGDSGIENDFRRDSGERRHRRKEFSNESEDEGFASSLLIASERQHTEDNFAKRNKKGYDSDRDRYNREDDPYRHVESMEYKSYKKQDYAPRERSIDDGSHFDPRIDKNVDKDRSTLKKMDKKPPKPEKKSSLEKMKQLFTSSKKKKEKENSLRSSRYTEYKGASRVEPKGYNNSRKEIADVNTGYDYNNRRRLSTPSPSPPREQHRNGKAEPSHHGSWFKSLDRLSRKKTKKGESNLTSTEDEIPKPTKNLRFFGDTDIESNDSVRHKSALKSRPGLSSRDRVRSQSSRDLHNISEESNHKNVHKSMLNIMADSDRDIKGSRMSLKPPASPAHNRSTRDLSRSREDRGRRRKNEVSSVESSTEGDSSQQSQRSVVYLHAATVGDIPGPGYLRNGRRAASREELASNSSSRIQPQVKTLSRSFSVLAPWKPRHYREGMDIDYTQYPKQTKNGKYEQNKNSSSRKESSTLKKKAQETRRSNQNMSTLNRKSRSKENISTLKREVKGSTSSLYKKKERQPKENNRYNRDDKRMASKSMSVESLGSNKSARKGEREVSRSISMPRDPEKSAGWFKKSSSKKTSSNQRA
ncbi:PREDICTED: uncharacterized protein LOC108563391 [Nicrophorus vespilloides]|uniref:Uncharacterized protein LOC108563391 n=1 Tax=Nicrophorus vespilloides TaxID=110193 RepID=A0ABM1MSJ1_NICVS|nr:PREDICTED: uncharacterized protein LOC108563391 [Nicrophorus vespilloides]